MSDTPGIVVERANHTIRLTLNNPARRNAMSYVMWDALGDALAGIHEDGDTRAVVLTGAGDKAFCAGNDITEFKEWRDDPSRHATYTATSRRAMDLLESLPVPAIARIQGVCVGGGMEIALACDMRIAESGARFAITPARLGLGYSLHDVALVVRTVGAAAARRLLYTGQMHDADTALEMGLVDAVHPVEALDPAMDELCDTITANAPLTLRAVKAAITESLRPEEQRDTARVQAMVDACHASADYQEGQRAFAEKRPPRFTGR